LGIGVLKEEERRTLPPDKKKRGDPAGEGGCGKKKGRGVETPASYLNRYIVEILEGK